MDLEIGLTPQIISECKKQGLLRNQCAYVLATAFWETNRTMQPVREAYWLSEGWRKRNLRYYPWYGRGLVQLTWKTNYARAGREIGADFLTDPDVVMKPRYAVPILVMGMRDGWFTGRDLGEFITLQKSDFHNARKIVNAMDKANTIAGIADDYDRALRKAGYGVKRSPTTREPSSLFTALLDALKRILAALKGGKA